MQMQMKNKSYLEVKEILNRLKENERKKIPNNIIELINNRAKEINCIIMLDNTIGLENQISREAISMLTYLTLKYIANPKEKEDMKEDLIENQKRISFSYKNKDEIFNKIKKEKNEKNTQLIVVKDNIWKKIYRTIKELFKF